MDKQTDYTVYDLEDLINFPFKEYKELENDELILKLYGALPVNIEKGFVPRYVFDVILKKDAIKIGCITLRAVLTKELLVRGGHIGYAIDEKYRGHNYAAKALTLLKPFITYVINGSVLITCDSDNSASRRTIEKIGGELTKIVKDIVNPDDNTKKDCCYYEIIYQQ
jgi:tagatose 1,6-diphosphate aldolase